MSTGNANEVLAAWEESSKYWNKHQALIEKMFAPLTRALIDAAQIKSGQAVLDVGGGSGEPSLTIAPLVGNSGSVSYTDPSAGMVDSARDAAQRRKVTNIRFHQAPAEHLPFPDNSFDVAVSRLAVMFFPDVLAGLREILRVVKPGAYVSFLVWSAKEVNPFFSTVTSVLDRFVPAEPEDEDAPGAFRFVRTGKLKELLSGAGAGDVVERSLAFQIEAPINIESFWELRSEMSDTLRGKLKKLQPHEVATIRNEIEKVVAPYFQKGQMNFPAQALVVRGIKRVG